MHPSWHEEDAEKVLELLNFPHRSTRVRKKYFALCPPVVHFCIMPRPSDILLPLGGGPEKKIVWLRLESQQCICPACMRRLPAEKCRNQTIRLLVSS